MLIAYMSGAVHGAKLLTADVFDAFEKAKEDHIARTAN